MFHELGYEYVLNPNLDHLRQDLTWIAEEQPQGEVFEQRFHRYLRTVASTKELPPLKGLRVLSKPADRQAFMVNLPFRAASVVVFLPGFGQDAGAAYENLLASGVSDSISGSAYDFDLDREQRLRSPEYAAIGEKLWTDATAIE